MVRLPPLFVFATVSALLLGGCSKESPDKAPESADAGAVAPAPEPAVEPAGEPSADAGAPPAETTADVRPHNETASVEEEEEVPAVEINLVDVVALESLATDVLEEPAPDVGEEPAPDVGEEPAPDVGEEPAPDVGEEPTPDAVASSIPDGISAEPADAAGAAPTDAAAQPVPDAVAEPAPDATEPESTADVGPATPPVTQSPKVNAEASRKVFEEARKLIEAGKLSKATELLEEWLKREPMDLVNRRNLVHVYMKLGSHEAVLPHLRFMTQEAASKGEWFAHLGRVLAQLGEYANAAEALEKALLESPEDIDLALDLARIHSTRRDYESARRVLEKALQLDQKTPLVLKELAAVLVELGEYNEAFKTFRRLQRLDPTYETALTMATIASQYERCDDVVDALADWEKSFTNEQPHVLLGACALKAKEKVKAQKHFMLGLAANEKCFYCALWLGDVYFETMDWDNAIKYYAKAAPVKPRDYRAFNQLGKALANSNKHIEAARAFEKADERKPNDPEILHMWGTELVRAGEKAKAWDVWGKLDPLDAAKAGEIKALLVQ